MDIIKFLSQSNSTLVLSTVAATFTILFAREFVKLYLSIRHAQSQYDGERLNAGEPAAAPPAAGERPELQSATDVVTWNFRLLEKYYDQTLGEYRLNSRASIVVAGLGFAVILIGIGFAYNNSMAVGTVSSIAGVIAEAASVMFFRQNQMMMKQVEEYHKKLVSTQYLLTAVSLADGLSELNRETEKHQIIVNLLYLSNELHGAKSDHLFAESP